MARSRCVNPTSTTAYMYPLPHRPINQCIQIPISMRDCHRCGHMIMRQRMHKLRSDAHLDRPAISISLLPMKLTGCGALTEIAACTASDSADSIESFLSR